jgi:phage-related protein
MDVKLKPLVWIGDSRKSLMKFPEEVLHDFGTALMYAQAGEKHQSAKPLKGFGGAGVLEVVEDHASDTYRAVYTVKLAGVVYALHTFKKKSKQGISTPKPDMDKIEDRLKEAKRRHKDWTTGKRSEP